MDPLARVTDTALCCEVVPVEDHVSWPDMKAARIALARFVNRGNIGLYFLADVSHEGQTPKTFRLSLGFPVEVQASDGIVLIREGLS